MNEGVSRRAIARAFCVTIPRWEACGLLAEHSVAQQEASTRQTRDDATRCHEEALGQLSDRLARLYRLWLAIVLVVLVVGTALDLIEDRQLETHTVPLSGLLARLTAGDPAALETAALLIVALGPVAGLVMIVANCARSGDRRTALLALAVLVVVAVLPVARSFAGR
ncbi:hypothetical protein [Thermomicrobium sp.]